MVLQKKEEVIMVLSLTDDLLLHIDRNSLVSLESKMDIMEELGQSLGSMDMFDDISPCDDASHGDRKSWFTNSLIYRQDRFGDTLLHDVIICDKRELSLEFIDKASSFRRLSKRNRLFQTPLHIATILGQSDVVRKLVCVGADITQRDSYGNTPLHIACRDGNMKIVQFLTEPVRDHETTSALYKVPQQEMPQDFSIVNYDGMTCLHLAAVNKHIDIVRYLIDKRADVNMVEHKAGRTILHYACISGDIFLVRLLLQHKMCNINARMYAGCTPFDLARAHKQEDICTVLAAAGARYGEDSDEE